jgi:hypothetical protein
MQSLPAAACVKSENPRVRGSLRASLRFSSLAEHPLDCMVRPLHFSYREPTLTRVNG